MIELSASLSDPLVELIRAGLAPVQALEAGPWHSPDQIRQYRRQLPGCKFHFHHSNLISSLKWRPGTRRRLNAYLDCTDTPWVSVHLALLPPGYLRLGLRWKWYPPSPDPDRMAASFVKEVDRLTRQVPSPVILENMSSLPTRRYAYEVDPRRVTEIIRTTACGFLLDIAHARVAADVHGWDVHAYLAQLPLDKTVQVHVSGPRWRDGHLFDAHEPLQEEDYALLEWVLARTRPKIVTLEYFRQSRQIREQLSRLKAMLA
jgi:uncharacterized protein (UPF0276 family)